jgi:probable HAF family extracellular repeat protein
VTFLGNLGGTSTQAVAINDKGQVLGNWMTPGGQQRGFVYYQGTQRDIGTIPGWGTRYVDINNAGYILASGDRPLTDPFGLSPFGFLRSPNGKFQKIGTLPFENAITQVEALNNRNQITGESGTLFRPETPFHAFIWSRGVMRNLGNIGYTPNYGLAINDRGQVAGYVATATFREALATLFSNGRVILIDTRPAGSYRFSTADAINNHGHIVGSSNHLGAFVYRGKRMESLNTLIDRKSGWNIQFPRAINDAGQIAANGFRNGVQYTVRLDLIRPHALGAARMDED